MQAALKRLREEAKQNKLSDQPDVSSSSSGKTISPSKPTPTSPSTKPISTSPPPLLERIVNVNITPTLNVQLRIMQDPYNLNYIHGGTVWDSSILLGKYISEFEGRALIQPNTKVIELGCGTSLCGLTASVLGADVTLTDLPTILPIIQINIDKNKDALRRAIAFSTNELDRTVHRPKEVVVLPLDWYTNIDVLKETQFDVILGADLMYDPKLAIPLANTITRLISKHTTIILSHEHRKDSVDLCYKNAFLAQDIVMEEIGNNGRWDNDLSLYCLKKIEMKKTDGKDLRRVIREGVIAVLQKMDKENPICTNVSAEEMFDSFAKEVVRSGVIPKYIWVKKRSEVHKKATKLKFIKS